MHPLLCVKVTLAHLLLLSAPRSAKCTKSSANPSALPKCSTVTKDKVEPCIYDGPTNKRLIPLTAIFSTDKEDVNDLHNENWSKAHDGNIHYMYRGQGLSGSLGVNDLTSQIPHHSSYCYTYEEYNEHGSGTKTAKFVAGDTHLETVTSHVEKKCIPIPYLKHIQYVMRIGVGTPPQYVNPLIDTGSTNTWIVSSNCNSETCTNVHKFNEGSSTFVPIDSQENAEIKIKFGTGVIVGKPASDNFEIQGDIVKNQVFGLVEQEIPDRTDHNVFKMIKFEGIVGLGFPDMAWNSSLPLYDNYSKTIGANLIFSLYFSNDKKYSALLIGGVDNRFYKEEIKMLPLIREYYWEVQLSELWIGNNKLCCSTNSYVIFDSGTSFNTLPHDEFSKFKTFVPYKNCNGDLDSVLSEYPVIKYVFTGGISVEIRPEQYLFIAKGICKPAYMQINVPSAYGNAYILGTNAFMKHFYTIQTKNI
ncbi:pepsinogen, putative [Theileria equi strain WA]|uniref:Pepsinogen, putative n=1 Tax=Theileria equi strain WA TaxID=1537102 RepID=L1LEY4_THEEQ|nr:pepsinogen, putative [Theileria equi strain WA]EKX73733.1 pepsinogen, putative [Theileria equi strain WA]|eukprot:XP_004833185.1 pepsinogen, putative [Theileria equi strain WA]